MVPPVATALGNACAAESNLKLPRCEAEHRLCMPSGLTGIQDPVAEGADAGPDTLAPGSAGVLEAASTAAACSGVEEDALDGCASGARGMCA